MDVIRRNTDYAMRLICGLVKNFQKKPVSARQLAEEFDVSYELSCKLMQKLAAAKLVRSVMGAAGGFEIAKPPSEISLLQVIEAVQGGISFNRCVPDPKKCPNGLTCGICKKLTGLQNYIEEYLKKTMLSDL